MRKECAYAHILPNDFSKKIITRMRVIFPSDTHAYHLPLQYGVPHGEHLPRGAREYHPAHSIDDPNCAHEHNSALPSDDVHHDEHDAHERPLRCDRRHGCSPW